MTQKDLEKLPPGSFVVHQRYGLCTFRLEYGLGGGPPMPLFRIIITPVNLMGRFHLQEDFASNIPDLMIPTGRVLKPFISTKQETT